MHGYAQTSITDLIQATGANRQALYHQHAGKHGLLVATLQAYIGRVVDPAFKPVEQPNAGWHEIKRYFYDQIVLAEQVGLPGPGCFIANCMTELAPHDAEIKEIVMAHHDRLRRGFAYALPDHISHPLERAEIGEYLAIKCAGVVVTRSNDREDRTTIPLC